MEKFSKWRDASTGIQPFLPPRPPASTELDRRVLHALKYYAMGPLVALVRLTLAGVVMLWLLVFLTIAAALPVAPLRWGLRTYVSALGCRAVLLLLGFWWIGSEWTTLRKGRDAPATSGVPGGGLRSGDVVVANWSSYVDVLYLGFRFAPTFTRIVRSGAQHRLVPVSLFGALRQTFAVPTLAGDASEPSFTLPELQARAASSWGGPIVVFPEATTSNNRAVLAFVPVLVPTASRALQIVGLKYSYDDYAPTYTAGSPWAHVFGLACQAVNTLEAHYLPRGEAEGMGGGASGASSSGGGDVDEDAMGAQVAAALVQMLRLRRARLGVADKVAFLEFYTSQKARGRRE